MFVIFPYTQVPDQASAGRMLQEETKGGTGRKSVQPWNIRRHESLQNGRPKVHRVDQFDCDCLRPRGELD